MNEPYIQDRSTQRREVVAVPVSAGAHMRNAWVSHHITVGSGATGGYSPVGGDSLLVAQAGGGSCTRRGELKLRRKEEDCGKREQREGMRMSEPMEYLAFLNPT